MAGFGSFLGLPKFTVKESVFTSGEGNMTAMPRRLAREGLHLDTFHLSFCSPRVRDPCLIEHCATGQLVNIGDFTTDGEREVLSSSARKTSFKLCR